MTGKPQSHRRGILGQIERYFERNPAKEVSKAELMALFDASEAAVEAAIHTLKAEGLLARRIVYFVAEEV